MRNMLEEFEKKYKFQYPNEYIELYEAGILDYKSKCKLFCEGSYDCVLMSIERIKSELENRPDYWNPKYKLVPFARTGGGDWYAFCFNLQNDNNVPIVVVYHDDDEMEVLANNIIDFIIYYFLQCTISIGYELETISVEDYRENMLRELEVVKKYIDLSKYEKINKIFEKNELIRYLDLGKYEDFGFLDYDLCDDMIAGLIGFHMLHKKIKYQI